MITCNNKNIYLFTYLFIYLFIYYMTLIIYFKGERDQGNTWKYMYDQSKMR